MFCYLLLNDIPTFDPKKIVENVRSSNLDNVIQLDILQFDSKLWT